MARVLATVAAAAINACGGHGCKLIATPGIEVTVQTAAGAPICDAVVAVDSSDGIRSARIHCASGRLVPVHGDLHRLGPTPCAS